MAVAFVAYIDGTSSNSSTTATVSMTGRSVGEYMLVQISRNAVVAPSSTPSGWTLLQSHASTYGVWLYGKVLDSGDLSGISWNWAAGAKTLCKAAVYSGVDNSSPVESSSKGTYGTGSAQTLNLGSVTTNETMIAVLASCYSTAAKTYDLSSQTLSERRDAGGTAPDFWHYLGDKNAAWGGGTFTPSTSTNYISAASTYRGGFLVVLKAATATDMLDPLGVSGFFGA